MKILELKLKKDVLIVDENDFGYYTNIDNEIIFHLGNVRLRRVKGNFKLLCKGSELTEEIASKLVKKILPLYYAKQNRLGISLNSSRNDLTKSAKKSFISEVESKGFHWLKHDVRSFSLYDPRSKTGWHDLEEEDTITKQWQEAEEKTFRNPVIFIKKS